MSDKELLEEAIEEAIEYGEFERAEEYMHQLEDIVIAESSNPYEKYLDYVEKKKEIVRNSYEQRKNLLNGFKEVK